MTAAIIRFPRCQAAVWITRERDGSAWIVPGPRGHWWLHAALDQARADAMWLSKNAALPIREVVS